MLRNSRRLGELVGRQGPQNLDVELVPAVPCVYEPAGGHTEVGLERGPGRSAIATSQAVVDPRNGSVTKRIWSPAFIVA